MKFIDKLALKISKGLNEGGNYDYISKKNVGDNIPKVIHQTYYNKTFTPEILENINYLKSMNPDWEHKVYDDADIINYITTHYPELVAIYNKINPAFGAARADFFRYLLIYNEGGVYLDIKSSLNKPLKEIIAPDDCYLLSYWQNGPDAPYPQAGLHACISNPFGELQQWHIVAVKGHPFLKAVIENVCNNIQNYNPLMHDTGGWVVLNITGPIAYTLAIEPHLNEFPHRLARNNLELGFVYSIYESKNIGTNHLQLGKKHYTLLDESLTILPVPYKVIFNIIKPCIKLTRKFLSKLRS